MTNGPALGTVRFCLLAYSHRKCVHVWHDVRRNALCPLPKGAPSAL